MVAGNVADVLEVHAAPFNDQEHSILIRMGTGDGVKRVGIGTPSWPVGTADRESSAPTMGSKAKCQINAKHMN
jgi:hypothetical protein